MNAECRDYDDLRAALRARAEQLNISRQEIDRISGLPSGYSGAVLSETSRKRIGWHSITPMLSALGCKLLLVEDPEAMARYVSRAEPRTQTMAHTNTRRLTKNVINRAKLVIFEELGRKGAAAMLAKTTPAERAEWARRAVAKRWQNYRARRAAAGG